MTILFVLVTPMILCVGFRDLRERGSNFLLEFLNPNP